MLEVHHIRPLAADGDAYDASNLRALCRPCHMLGHGKRHIEPGMARDRETMRRIARRLLGV